MFVITQDDIIVNLRKFDCIRLKYVKKEGYSIQALILSSEWSKEKIVTIFTAPEDSISQTYFSSMKDALKKNVSLWDVNKPDDLN